ncbi:NAD(+) synthase [Reichenbachiella versicolor]|uniref:NAD(+) synthase n=1 Tax=Reichenbachiella versicolor TaxID=1821036 RepID=UPI000D6E77C6|nr:NAD(+) synthase [Reichenbachiella versicolor]
MKQVKIGGAALNQTPIDWEKNFQNILSAIKDAKNQQVDILCLSELSITAYGCQDLFLSEWISETALKKLIELIPFTEDIDIIVGLPVIHESKTYNSICYISNTNILGFYCKQFLANDGIHYEKRWFDPWPSNLIKNIEIEGQLYPIGDITISSHSINIGFEVCEDAWHIDRPACRLAGKNIDLIANPSASHFALNKIHQRETLVIDSSKKFECHYLYVNQLGNESGRVIYDGDVLIASYGTLNTRANRLSFKDYTLATHILGTNSQAKLEKHPSQNEEFGAAASLALFDYMRKSRSKGYTLSLSGGADSSSIAVLVAEAIRRAVDELGIEECIKKLNLPSVNSSNSQEAVKAIVGQILFTAYQGTKNSGNRTLESARELARSIGAQFTDWKIDNIIHETHNIVEEAIDRKLTWETDDIALQNIQARSRSPLIWMIANIQNSILLTTSNRSEGDVGYTTMDGDTSGSLAPIAGIDKPFIIQWLKFAEKELGYTGLKYVNSLTPTAELRPKEYVQTDEDDLMPYWIMVKIEKLGIYQRKSPLEVFYTLLDELDIERKVLKGYISKFYRLWSINQWKRERLAPSFHIDDFNVDPKTWCRFPILSGSFKKELEDLEKL